MTKDQLDKKKARAQELDAEITKIKPNYEYHRRAFKLLDFQMGRMLKESMDLKREIFVAEKGITKIATYKGKKKTESQPINTNTPDTVLASLQALTPDQVKELAKQLQKEL